MPRGGHDQNDADDWSGSPVMRVKFVTRTGHSLDTANPGRDPRRAPQNIFKERESSKGTAHQTASIKDAFELLVTNEMLDQILTHTNKEGDKHKGCGMKST